MAHNLRQLSGRIIDFLIRGYDSKWKSRGFLFTTGTLMFLFPFSLFFVAGGFLPADFGWISSVVIILVGVATMFSELRCERVVTTVGRLVGISGTLFVVEYVGMSTGFPFGTYQYTGKLGLHLAGVPIAIAIAWYATIINAWRIADRLSRGGLEPVVTAALAGLFALGLDIALEPMAGFIEKYWEWEGNVVPLQNYVSWFVLSACAAYVLARTRQRTRPEASRKIFPAALFLFGFNFILFFLTILVNGYIVMAISAMAFVLAPFAIRWQQLSVVQPHPAGQ